MRTYRLIALASLSAPLAGFVACSSSNNNNGGSEDAGPSDAAPMQDSTLSDGNGSSGGGDSGGETSTSEAGGIAQMVTQTNLFADTAEGGAPNVDPNLVNAWGLAFNPTGIAWVSDNGTGLATLYQPNMTAPLPRVVTIPPPTGAEAGTMATPTGQVLNAGATAGDFKGDLFIQSTEDGTVTGWNATTSPFDAGKADATLEYDNSAAGAVYKGLAIDPSTPPRLLLADFHNGRIDVLDRMFLKIPVVDGGVDGGDGGTAWVDPSVPSGFAPFNIVVLSGKVYVAYAKQNAMAHDDVAAVGNGAISVFDTDGNLLTSLIKTGGVLDSPWGMALAPSAWGQLGGMLIVGNFGDGHVNAFNPTTGAFVGSLESGSTALKIDGLWSLVYGVDSPEAGVSPAQLYFTAGPNMEKSGLFGFLTAQ
jgi:uncharacterized protein (TIGR03118 family)